MSNVKSYRDSALSALIIVSWFVIMFRICNSASVNNSNAIFQFIWTWIITISIGIFGGIGIHLTSLLKMKGWQNSFLYNLIATLNIIVGCFGMMLPRIEGKPTPYLIAASLAVGLIMYKSIYGRTSWNGRKMR